MSRRSVPCAIYTRKSTDEGLDQAFNSLDAQRAACSAYIKSQVGAGWTELAALYDDGAQSGGTLDRPALRRLLADVSAGRVKVVVVYKVDRLTRSLADFAKIIEVLEANDASFVSITQQFSTTTSMGRLTLNVLLSFAQFEREVTAERIRDKIAASKKKGMWMGGVVPLGYDVRDRKLVVNEGESKVVRALFELYLQHGNTQFVKAEADRLGLRTKRRRTASGREQGGEPFTRGHINKILNNRLYIGEVAYKGGNYAGEHVAIIKSSLWDSVQAQLARNAVTRRWQANATEPSLLTGLLTTSDGARLVPSHTTKNGQRYRYYVSGPGSGEAVDRWRLPATALEQMIIELIRGFLSDRQRLSAEMAPAATAQTVQGLLTAAAAFADQLGSATSTAQREELLAILRGVEISPTSVTLTLDGAALRRQIGDDDVDGDNNVMVRIPISLRRRGVETRLVIENDRSPPSVPDARLVGLLVDAHRWFSDLKDSRAGNVNDLAQRDGVHPADISRVLPLAFLAPDIVEAFLDGRQPPELTAARLKRMRDLPLDWQQQRWFLGFHRAS